MRIARVFPVRTIMTPSDRDAYIGTPDLLTPHYDIAYISVTFTWDKDKASQLLKEWQSHADVVTQGGPAFGDPGGEFVSGEFLKTGITITSRGCPNACGFCLVPMREGKLRELPIVPGNIIQDNNFLACSDTHRAKVYSMLSHQKRICFRGGLEAARITTKESDALRGLHIRELWLACDHDGAITPLRQAVTILKAAGFKTYQLRCYVLIGHDMARDEARLREVLAIGCLPFAQLYQPPERIEYSKEWKDFNRKWSRPAAYRSKNFEKINVERHANAAL